MKIEKTTDGVHLNLTTQELKLLRRALERASYVDTPVDEQPAILQFCAQALDSLPEPGRS